MVEQNEPIIVCSDDDSDGDDIVFVSETAPTPDDDVIFIQEDQVRKETAPRKAVNDECKNKVEEKVESSVSPVVLMVTGIAVPPGGANSHDIQGNDGEDEATCDDIPMCVDDHSSSTCSSSLFESETTNAEADSILQSETKTNDAITDSGVSPDGNHGNGQSIALTSSVVQTDLRNSISNSHMGTTTSASDSQGNTDKPVHDYDDVFSRILGLDSTEDYSRMCDFDIPHPSTSATNKYASQSNSTHHSVTGGVKSESGSNKCDLKRSISDIGLPGSKHMKTSPHVPPKKRFSYQLNQIHRSMSSPSAVPSPSPSVSGISPSDLFTIEGTNKIYKPAGVSTASSQSSSASNQLTSGLHKCQQCNTPGMHENMSWCMKSHACCKSCIEGHVKVLLAKSEKGSFKCTVPGCGSYFLLSQLQRTLPNMVVEILEDKLDQEYVDDASSTLLRSIASPAAADSSSSDEEMEEDDGDDEGEQMLAWDGNKPSPARFKEQRKIDCKESSNNRQEVIKEEKKKSSDLPENWDDMDENVASGFVKIEVEGGTDEYIDVSQWFYNTMPFPKAEIMSLERVQNPTLWKFYSVKKQQMMRDNKSIDERRLFHGTKPSVVDVICRDNFDWRVWGTNGTMYGQGSYFAVDASYSHKYSNVVPVNRSRPRPQSFLQYQFPTNPPPARISTSYEHFRINQLRRQLVNLSNRPSSCPSQQQRLDQIEQKLNALKSQMLGMAPSNQQTGPGASTSTQSPVANVSSVTPHTPSQSTSTFQAPTVQVKAVPPMRQIPPPPGVGQATNTPLTPQTSPAGCDMFRLLNSQGQSVLLRRRDFCSSQLMALQAGRAATAQSNTPSAQQQTERGAGAQSNTPTAQQVTGASNNVSKTGAPHVQQSTADSQAQSSTANSNTLPSSSFRANLANIIADCFNLKNASPSGNCTSASSSGALDLSVPPSSSTAGQGNTVKLTNHPAAPSNPSSTTASGIKSYIQRSSASNSVSQDWKKFNSSVARGWEQFMQHQYGGQAASASIIPASAPTSNLPTVANQLQAPALPQSSLLTVSSQQNQNAPAANNSTYEEPPLLTMVVGKVLVGRFTRGHNGLRRPPPLDQNNPLGKCHDSCVDSQLNPKIFVIFDSSQCYPEYIIRYKMNSCESEL